jgi:hypothetical protein
MPQAEAKKSLSFAPIGGRTIDFSLVYLCMLEIFCFQFTPHLAYDLFSQEITLHQALVSPFLMFTKIRML